MVKQGRVRTGDWRALVSGRISVMSWPLTSSQISTPYDLQERMSPMWHGERIHRFASEVIPLQSQEGLKEALQARKRRQI